MNRRLPAFALALALTAATGAATAQQRAGLPDIGSSAGTVLSPAQQAEYGAMVLAQLRHEGYVVDDPLLDGWPSNISSRVTPASRHCATW